MGMKKYNGTDFESAIKSLPLNKLRDIPNKIYEIMKENDLSVAQAQALLEITKDRLLKVKL